MQQQKHVIATTKPIVRIGCSFVETESEWINLFDSVDAMENSYSHCSNKNNNEIAIVSLCCSDIIIVSPIRMHTSIITNSSRSKTESNVINNNMDFIENNQANEVRILMKSMALVVAAFQFGFRSFLFQQNMNVFKLIDSFKSSGKSFCLCSFITILFVSRIFLHFELERKRWSNGNGRRHKQVTNIYDVMLILCVRLLSLVNHLSIKKNCHMRIKCVMSAYECEQTNHIASKEKKDRSKWKRRFYFFVIKIKLDFPSKLSLIGRNIKNSNISVLFERNFDWLCDSWLKFRA